MKKTSVLILATITFFVMISCNSEKKEKTTGDKKPRGEISISGAFALYPLTVKWAEEFNKTYPDIRIDISAGGAGKGMADALSGMVDLGMFSREVSPEEEAKGAWKIAVAKDAVLPTCNACNPDINTILKSGFCRKDFIELFLNDDKHYYWNNFFDIEPNNSINIYTRSDACGAAQMWGLYLGANQEKLHGIGVFGDPGMADAVKNDPYGIGYNNVIYIYDIQSRKKYKGLEVIPIDLNNDGIINPEEDFYGDLDSVMAAIKNNIYPAPPARDLYFVSKGQPNNTLVLLFLEWILTKGQDFVAEAGYVKLSEQKINNELKRLP